VGPGNPLIIGGHKFLVRLYPGFVADRRGLTPSGREWQLKRKVLLLQQLPLPFDYLPHTDGEIKMGYGSQGTKKDRQGKAPNGAKPQRFNDVQFVRRELDKAEAAQCKTWEVDEARVFDAIHKLCEGEYSFSLKWDDFSSAFACFMQFRGSDGVNKDLILTGRGSSPFKAAKQALFKHYQLLDGVWTEFAERKMADEIDD